MLVASDWQKSIHQNIEDALKRSSAMALIRNAYCLLQGKSKKQLPDGTCPCPVSQHIYTWQGSHAHHVSSWQVCSRLLEGQIALYMLSDSSQFMKILLRECPREVPNWARLRCICPSTCPLSSWSGCSITRQAGAWYLMGHCFLLEQRQRQQLPQLPAAQLGYALPSPSFSSTSLQILSLASPTEKN